MKISKKINAILWRVDGDFKPKDEIERESGIDLIISENGNKIHRIKSDDKDKCTFKQLSKLLKVDLEDLEIYAVDVSSAFKLLFGISKEFTESNSKMRVRAIARGSVEVKISDSEKFFNNYKTYKFIDNSLLDEKIKPKLISEICDSSLSELLQEKEFKRDEIDNSKNEYSDKVKKRANDQLKDRMFSLTNVIIQELKVVGFENVDNAINKSYENQLNKQNDEYERDKLKRDMESIDEINKFYDDKKVEKEEPVNAKKKKIKYCVQCGEELEDNANYCNKCGCKQVKL